MTPRLPLLDPGLRQLDPRLRQLDPRLRQLGRIGGPAVHSETMPPDPWEILGVGRDASLADAKAAYRRLAALFHPDHLQGMSDAVRAEGERRLREVVAAFEALQNRLGPRTGPDAPGETWARDPAGGRPTAPDRPAAPESRAYNAQVRGLDREGLHATWPGRHAAAMWAALRHAHAADGPVQQVEWGAYECTIHGSELRRLLSMAMGSGEVDWRRVPLEVLHMGPSGQRRTYHGHPGNDPPGVMDLEALAELVDDDCRYLVTAEIFSGFE